MNRKDILHYLSEFQMLKPDKQDGQEFLTEAAFFIEDLFHITLTDEEITDENLGSHDALNRFVLTKLCKEGECAESAE